MSDQENINVCNVPGKCAGCGEHTWCVNSEVSGSVGVPIRAITVMLVMMFGFGSYFGWIIAARHERAAVERMHRDVDKWYALWWQPRPILPCPPINGVTSDCTVIGDWTHKPEQGYLPPMRWSSDHGTMGDVPPKPVAKRHAEKPAPSKDCFRVRIHGKPDNDTNGYIFCDVKIWMNEGDTMDIGPVMSLHPTGKTPDNVIIHGFRGDYFPVAAEPQSFKFGPPWDDGPRSGTEWNLDEESCKKQGLLWYDPVLPSVENPVYIPGRCGAFLGVNPVPIPNERLSPWSGLPYFDLDPMPNVDEPRHSGRKKLKLMSDRSKRISNLLTSLESRTSYIRSKLGVLVPSQIRSLRLKSSMPRQADLARESKMHQSRISMFEMPGSANVTLDTLSRLAAAFKVGLVVEFVPFSEMLKWENDFSQETFRVTKLEDDAEFLQPDAYTCSCSQPISYRQSNETQPQPGFTVEELRPNEAKALDDAEKEFSAAQSKHEAVINQIRAAHGQTQYSYLGRWVCGGIRTTVEIRGHYALITREPDNAGCPVMTGAP